MDQDELRSIMHGVDLLNPADMEEATANLPSKIGLMIDECYLCKRKFASKNLDQTRCRECSKLTAEQEEKIHRDNMFGMAERLGPRASAPRKIGGRYSGGGIETPEGRRKWREAGRAWAEKFQDERLGRAYDPAVHQLIRRHHLEEDNTDDTRFKRQRRARRL